VEFMLTVCDRICSEGGGLLEGLGLSNEGLVCFIPK
jgi:hypothetical protein